MPLRPTLLDRADGARDFYSSMRLPAVYPAVVLVFLALGVTELIVWAATIKGW